MTRPKILVTGASGFIGKHIIDFLSKNYVVYAFGRKKPDGLSKVEFRCGHLLDKEAILKAMDQIDIIIHLASIVDSNNKDIHVVNVNGTRLLIEAANRAGVKKIIYLSTDNIYFHINNAYTKTKRSAEAIIGSFRNFTIIRPAVVYGPGEKSYFHNLVRIIQTWPAIPLIGNGQNKLQPIYVNDVVHCVHEAIAQDVTGTYVIAGGSEVTYERLIDLMMMYLNKKKKKIFIPISFLYPFLFFYQKIFPKPLMDIRRLKNFSVHKTHNISEAEHTFKIRFLKIEDGLQQYFQRI